MINSSTASSQHSPPTAAPNKRSLGLLILILLLLCAIAAAARFASAKADPEWYLQASGQFTQGHVVQAMQELEAGLASNPHCKPAYELLSDCYLANRQMDKALLTLQRLQTLDPDRPHVATRIAEASISRDPDSLLASARAATIQEPRSPRARMLLAYALARSGREQDALSEATLSNHLSPSPQVSQGIQIASALQVKDDKFAQTLRSVIFSAPYE